jgi:hypothetical protein
MALKKYQSGGLTVMYKTITERVGSRQVALGLAFRTADAPIGYLPFYSAHDFDFSGETSLKEQLLARLTMGIWTAGSPHALLIKAAAGDVEFLGSGDEELQDIQRLVRMDLHRYAMSCASGVFVEGIMLALGGPTIKAMVQPLLKSRVQQFIVAKAISGATKQYLKDQGRLDADKLLSQAP